MTSSVHDVVVVGAQPAGAATAMLLARAGLDVLVLGHAPMERDALSTHALMRGGVLQLHRWGLLDAVVAAGTPPVRRTTFTYAGEVVPITIKPSHGVDALYAPRREVLEPILVAAAEAAGATVRDGTTVTALTRDRDGRVDGVEGHDERGRSVRHAGRWIVGADGVRSLVARAVRAAVTHRGTAATAVVCADFAGLDVDGYEWIFRPDACAGVIPTNDARACVFVAASPHRIGEGGLGALRELAAIASPSLADRLAAVRPPADVRSWSGLPGRVRRPWGPGWALVGDAGYWRDPICAHGPTAALRDAELLARAVLDAAGGRRPDSVAFDEYERTRDRLSRPLFDVVDAVAGMRWTDADIAGLVLQLNSSLSDEVDALTLLTAPATLRDRRTPCRSTP